MAKAPVGVVLTHGFTSHINCIDPLVPRLEKHGIPYRMPVLRGHGTKPADLRGVRWQDWVEDGQQAFDDLLNECEKVLPVGISMGGLVALHLAINNPAKTQAVVTLAPAFRLTSKLLPLAPLIAKVQKDIIFKPDSKAFWDEEAGRTNQNYMQSPSDALVRLIEFGKFTANPRLLANITVPILILASSQDRTVVPSTASDLLNAVSSRDKQLKWFDKSGHEMLRDAEREQVLDAIEGFVVAHAMQPSGVKGQL